MLLEYFALNDRDTDARQYVYGDIYMYLKKRKSIPLGKT